MRILFMVDNSGSTATTDPNDVHRVATVKTFLANYGTQTNLTYSYSYFASNAYGYDMVSTKGSFMTNPATTFGSAAELTAALDLFETINAGNTTNYVNAFDMIQKEIVDDEVTNTTSKYVVVFMSDGQPNEANWDTANEEANIKALVTSLLAVGNANRVSVSSVFFGDSTDTQSVTNLTAMAETGNGQFVDTNKTSTVTISDIITTPGCKASPTPTVSPSPSP